MRGIGRGRSPVDAARRDLTERLVRPHVVVLMAEGIEPRLLGRRVRGRRLAGLGLERPCIRSWRPFCCGLPGSIRSSRMPSLAQRADSRVSPPAPRRQRASRCRCGSPAAGHARANSASIAASTAWSPARRSRAPADSGCRHRSLSAVAAKPVTGPEPTLEVDAPAVVGRLDLARRAGPRSRPAGDAGAARSGLHAATDPTRRSADGHASSGSAPAQASPTASSDPNTACPCAPRSTSPQLPPPSHDRVGCGARERSSRPDGPSARKRRPASIPRLPADPVPRAQLPIGSSPRRQSATNSSFWSCTECAFHGIGRSPLPLDTVRDVSGLFCQLSIRVGPVMTPPSRNTAPPPPASRREERDEGYRLNFRNGLGPSKSPM